LTELSYSSGTTATATGNTTSGPATTATSNKQNVYSARVRNND
jgi:hypothetical protein